MKLLEERKKKLAAEGLFDEARKQLLPFLPRVIGVVTSPTGAVIRDILHRLQDRFPRRVLVWPVRVQGESSAAEVAAAIKVSTRCAEGGALPRPDLIIVARGGGSLEDLWSFNEEIVVRAAAASMIPLISAVGHETDVTLIDFAADRRAPTPTAAAEMAVPVRAELMSRVAAISARGSSPAGGAVSTSAARNCACFARAAGARRICWRCRASGSMPAPARLPRALRANAQIASSQLTRAASRLSPRLLSHRIERCREQTAAFGDRARRAFRIAATGASSACAAPAQLLDRLFLSRRARARLCAGARRRWPSAARRRRRSGRNAAGHRVFRRPRRRDGRRRARRPPPAKPKPRTRGGRRFRRAGEPVRANRVSPARPERLS